jgi:hypothetical protein
MDSCSALGLILAASMVAFGCNDGAGSGTTSAPAGTVPKSDFTAGVGKAPKGKSPIRSDADCRKAPVCRDFGACTHKGGQCTVTSDSDCAASSFCKMAGKCMAHAGQCRIGATKDEECTKSHGKAGLNPCATKGHCTAKDGVCQAGKDADCAKAPACRETGHCTAKEGICVVGSEKDCKQAMACTKLKACEFHPGKDGHGGICASPAGSGAPEGHEGHGH